MAGNEAIKVLTGLWADEGDRIDPDDASLDVTLARGTGFPASFSEDAGNNVPRRVWNQRFRELYGAARGALRFGIEPYDADIDYPQGGRCAVGRDVYYALTANGPTTSDAVHPQSPGQSAWSTVTGRVVLPSAPSTPTVTAGNSSLEVTWNCPRDGGRAVTSFSFQWRVGASGGWSASTTVVGSRYVLTGLTNAVAYQVRVRAHSSQGASPWSTAASGTPAAVRPSQVVGLVAFSGGDRQVALRWIEPDTGGAPISRYDIQWRSGSQSYGSTRQVTTSALSRSVGSLTNGIEYFFRVRAVNSAGTGQWSEDASATPEEPPPPPPVIPDDTTPGEPGDATSQVIGTRILWRWPIPQDGNRRITRFEVQIREDGEAWPVTNIDSISSCYLQTGAVSGTTYEARARAVNNLGTGGWSDEASQRA